MIVAPGRNSRVKEGTGLAHGPGKEFYRVLRTNSLLLPYHAFPFLGVALIFLVKGDQMDG